MVTVFYEIFGEDICTARRRTSFLNGKFIRQFIFHYLSPQCKYISQPKQFLGLYLQPVRVGVNWALVLFASKQGWIRQNVSQQLTLKCLKFKKMAESIVSDNDKSSNINKRVRVDGTLIKEVDNTEFVINDKTITSSSKSTK